MPKKTAFIISILSVLILLLGEMATAWPAEGRMAEQNLLSLPLSSEAAPGSEDTASPVQPATFEEADQSPQETISQAEPLYPDEDPIALIEDLNRGWAYGGGFLYWAYHCTGWSDPAPAFLKRQDENGVWPRTLGEASQSACKTFSAKMIADQDGVYYLNWHDQILVSHLTADPETPITIANADPALFWSDFYLTSDETKVYFTQADGIYRADKDSFGAAKTSDATGITSLAVDDSYIYWLDDAGLWRSDKTCYSSACWEIKEHIAVFPGRYLTWENEQDILWVGVYEDYWRLYHVNVNLGNASSLYTSPVGTTDNLGQPLYHEDTNRFFWIEDLTAEIQVRCMDAASMEVETLAFVEDLQVPAGKLAGNEQHLLFRGPNGLYGIPYDAEPLSWDLAVDEIEVTQAVQSLDNDVELVAGKPTFVRVYASMITGSHSINSAQVALHGYYQLEDELPGSPLLPLDGVQHMAVGEGRDRLDADEGWLFQLPASWTQEDSIRLEAEIDPHHTYSERQPIDNSLSRVVQFFSTAPVCLVFSPVHTHAGTQGTDAETFYPMIERAKQVWPASGFWTYRQSEPVEELEVCIKWLWGFIPIPYPCWGPYELPDNSIKILTTLLNRDNVSDDPDECDDAGARTHYVGMVHPSTNTSNVLGAARKGLFDDYDCDQLWVKFSPSYEPAAAVWNRPTSGLTLAHELGHNYERRHVDCGGPDEIDPNYPYTPSMLDDGSLTDPQTHFGFDFVSLQPINPHDNADFMSYCRPQWVSDYTWGHLFNKLNRALAASAAPAAAPVTPATPDLVQAESAVLVGGTLILSQGEGQLDYAWVFPTSTLSSGILRKWQRMAAPTWEAAGHPQQDVYHLRLLDASGTILDDRVFSPTTPIDLPEPKASLFSLTFPAPLSDVARLELLINDTVVDVLQPGASVPTVEVLQPTGGSFDQEMTLVWEASDADLHDDLLYIVQYTADDGQTWQALLTSFPGLPETERMTVTLSSFPDLPGSSNCRLRVVASDGYHTAMDTTPLFRTAHRRPQPYIIPPDADVAAGRTVLLRGGASDAEDGSVEEAALQWAVDGHEAFTGTTGTLQGLAPGSHTVSLVASDSSGLTGTAQVTVTVSPLYIAEVPYWAEQPELDGLCDDDAYTRGTMVSLEPYQEGGQGTVHMVRTTDSLWACFSGMARGVEDPMSFAALMADVDYSRENNPQEGDWAFVVYEDGTPATWMGLPGGGFDLETWAGGLQTNVFVTGTVWHAEMRIDSEHLDGWDHVVGLEPVHFCPICPDITHLWPYENNWSKPADWATTALGSWPQLSYMSPDERMAGQPGSSLLVYGQSFEDGAVVHWNGEPRDTSGGDTMLVTLLTAEDVATAGTAEVTVVNPGLELVPSNALIFTIVNPTPTITALDPVSATAGLPVGFTLRVTGSSFMPGAQILWNGAARSTTYVSSTLVTAKISPEMRAASREVRVMVVNAPPAYAASNEVIFTLARPVAPYSVYLPMILRNE